MKKWLFQFILALVLIIGAVPAHASLVMELDAVFSGYAPSNTTPPPWLTATFTDVTGGVQLTLEATNLASTEFVTEWTFNVNPDSPFPITNISATGGDTNAVSGTNFGTDVYKADGDGTFDIEFSFNASNALDRFMAGESITFTITGSGISASSFNTLSEGQNGGYPTLAHVQGIPITGSDLTNSGWITTPAPAAAYLLGSGLLALIGFGVRRKEKRA